jgi:hypothetical protein
MGMEEVDPKMCFLGMGIHSWRDREYVQLPWYSIKSEEKKNTR